MQLYDTRVFVAAVDDVFSTFEIFQNLRKLTENQSYVSIFQISY